MHATSRSPSSFEIMSDSTSKPPGIPPDPLRTATAFERLCEVVAKLRSPEGCPWDRRQTLESIKPYTLEETYELLEAIDSGDDAHIAEELGDVLLQVVLDAQIGSDEGRFELPEVIEGLTDKLVRRHPHVFGDAEARTPDQVKQNWDAAKQGEKQRASLLDGLPRALPQLARATRISDKAARAGYDWPQRNMLFDKLHEELGELAEELFPEGGFPRVAAGVEAPVIPDEPIDDPAARKRVENELGDILFVVANIARRWGINPEEALRRSNEKFEQRFRYIERRAGESGRKLQELSLIEMERFYQEGKQREADSGR
jgi:tetrapyrrole methylase family protein / MazG family protein